MATKNKFDELLPDAAEIDVPELASNVDQDEFQLVIRR